MGKYQKFLADIFYLSKISVFFFFAKIIVIRRFKVTTHSNQLNRRPKFSIKKLPTMINQP